MSLIAIILDEEKSHQAKKRKCVHKAWKKRENEREFATLYKELLDDRTKFLEYFNTMLMNKFNLQFVILTLLLRWLCVFLKNIPANIDNYIITARPWKRKNFVGNESQYYGTDTELIWRAEGKE